MITASQSAAMDQMVSDLRRALSASRLAVESSSDWLSRGTNSKANSENALDSSERDIGRLDGELRDAVAAGTWTFDHWVSVASDVHRAVASYGGDVGAWNISGILGNTVTATAQDVKKDAAAVVDAAPMVLAAVVVIVVGLVILKVV